MDLVSLVQSLGNRDSADHEQKDYEAALATYFRGDFAKSADQAANVLAEEPDCGARFQAYRLWIDSLAEAGDLHSLSELKSHLFTRGQADPDDHETYAALRAIAHFELDEFQAASLMARGVKDRVHNPYCMELVQLVESRTLDLHDEDHVPALLRCTGAVTDYFHWQQLARALVKRGGGEPLSETLSTMRSMFRKAPLPLVAEYHGQVDAGYYAGAAIYAERLCELYPLQVDYQYYKAFANFEDGNYPAARATLTRLVERHGEQDPEVVGLLGHCHAKLGEAEKAKHFLTRAVSLLGAEGLPSSHVRLELANVEDELRGDQLDPALEMPRETRMWLVPLSARRYNELMTASEPSVDRLLRPMGTSARSGDFVLFTAPPVDDGENVQHWSIVAIYTVDSEPMWHPVYRHHTALKLVCRLVNAIPMEVRTRAGEQGSGNKPGRDEPIHYGVYEIEQGHALDIIERAIEQQKNGIIERRSVGGKARRPSA